MALRLTLVAATLLLGLGVLACGGVAGGARSSTRASDAGHVIGDDDDDDLRPGHEPSDRDDIETRGYGRPAAASERRAVAATLQRYYAVAASGDGAATCRLLAARLAAASDLERFVPTYLRPAPGSSVFHDKGCAPVESLLLDLDRQQLAGEHATLIVSEVRVDHAEALAVMRFASTGERQIPLRREGGRWRVDALLDNPVL